MDPVLSRRAFTLTLPAAGLATAALASRALGVDPSPVATPGAAMPSGPDLASEAMRVYPRQALSMVEKTVGLSHRDLKGVQELVEAHPALANATHDWGFGDWETALGAASHTGQVEIAEYLISKGARPDIFTFAMLGNLGAVKAAIEGVPGLQRTRGPHGISLLSHAKAGGDRAKAVAAYLESLGDADPKYTDLPLTDDIKRPLLGSYTYGKGETERLEVGEGMGGLTIKRIGSSARRMMQQSPTEFHPAGAPAVRIKFDLNGSVAARVTITDHDLIVIGERKT